MNSIFKQSVFLFLLAIFVIGLFGCGKNDDGGSGVVMEKELDFEKEIIFEKKKLRNLKIKIRKEKLKLASV